MVFTLLLFFDDRQIPRGQREGGIFGHGFSIQQIGSGGVRVTQFHFRAAVVEVVMQPLAQLIDSVLRVNRWRELLVGTGKSEFLQAAAQDGGLQLIGEISPFVK